MVSAARIPYLARVLGFKGCFVCNARSVICLFGWRRCSHNLGEEHKEISRFLCMLLGLYFLERGMSLSRWVALREKPQNRAHPFSRTSPITLAMPTHT